ncbi:MAG TPA: SMC family ATPase [Blastocatellia bacterium]|nr:SMC family ATPase [Blastocatellia bacterium]
MLITRVELENIKNYEEASFEFEAGVTAISGPNGAGKTTIIEAIAWTLFDQLPYKKEDFLRRGAKKGIARVTFVSSLDGRQYTVHRDTSTGYYIYDPITKLRLVEQKQQVAGWLKQHLGVDPTTDLKTLFTSTIGVPQGMFTVDFAEQPARRKVSFDRVLRVDEYQKSSDDLRALVRLIESRDADLRERMARIEGEVAKLNELFAERARFEATAAQTKAELATAQAERERARRELERFAALRQRLERLTAEVAGLRPQVEQLARRAAEVETEVTRARDARAIVEAAADGYASYNVAYLRLQELEPLAARRDELRKAHSDAEHQRIRLETVIQGQSEKLAQIASDKAELERIAPLVVEQESLEARRSEIQTTLGEMKALASRLTVAEVDLQKFRQEYREVTQRVDEAESLRDLAGRVPALEQQRRDAEAELREARVQLERLNERQKELQRTQANVAKITGELHTIDREIEAGLRAEELAARLPQLEDEERALITESANLRARIERDEEIVAQAKGGLCPLLAERCLNMKEGQGLDQFFKSRAGSEREQLLSADRKRKALHAELKEAKAALKTATALATQRVQRERYAQELEIERKNASRLDREIAGAKVNAQTIRQLGEGIAVLERETAEAREAKAKFDRLDLLRERLEALKIEGGEKRQEVATLKDRLEQEADLKKELSVTEARLTEIADPRGRSRLLAESVAKEDDLRRQLQEFESQEQQLMTTIAGLEKALAEFARLDEELAAERARRASSEKDYRAYVENQPIAERLDAREAELREVNEELATRRAQVTELDRELAETSADYDEAAHLATRVRLESLIDQVATLTSMLNAAETRLAELNGEIDRLLAAQKQLETLGRERERCEQLHALADFMRDLLRKAGPFITEAHLQSISIEANQLYREITGNPMVTLRWDSGYEIILEEDGHERPFASLSGGEQMAAALSVRLALLKELSDMRVAFFDEPTTNMDEERRRNLAQQIGRIRDFDQLFVISHDDTFEGFTDRVVAVKA